jgi:hypothetical protein
MGVAVEAVMMLAAAMAPEKAVAAAMAAVARVVARAAAPEEALGLGAAATVPVAQALVVVVKAAAVVREGVGRVTEGRDAGEAGWAGRAVMAVGQAVVRAVGEGPGGEEVEALVVVEEPSDSCPQDQLEAL